MGIAPNYPTVCLLLFAAGISSALYHVVGPVLITRVSGGLVGRGMSYWMTAGELARTVGPVVAVSLVAWLTFGSLYPVMIVGFLASVFLLIKLKGTPSVPESIPDGGLRRAWIDLRRVMIPMTGILVSRSFMVAALSAFLPTYMVAGGKSLWIGGSALAVLELSGTAGTFLAGSVSDRVGRRVVLLVALPSAALLMAAFVCTSGLLSFFFLILLGLTVFSVAPVALAITQDHSAGRRGAANGLFMGINFITTAMVVLLVGWLADLVGLRIAFIISALCGLAGAPAIFLLPRSRA